jgi:uncharacterized membrane protein
MGNQQRSGVGRGMQTRGEDRRSQADTMQPEDRNLAKFLGWFSIGLGIVQILAPRQFLRAIGVRDDEDDNLTITTLVGLREISAGVGILSRPRPVNWIRARVAGDVMDLALLGSAFTSDDGDEKEKVAAAAAAVVGISVVDLLASERLSRRLPDVITSGTEEHGAIHVRHSITIRRPVDEVYRFWSDFENLARFMSHLESVSVTGPKQSHWKAKGPAGRTVEWDAMIILDTPNEVIAWESQEGADVYNTGRVRFAPAPGDRGTEVRVEMLYEPPAGKLGSLIAKLFGEAPEIQVADDLKVFKQIMETGERVVSEGAITGERMSQRPAQPPQPQDAAQRMIKAQEGARPAVMSGRRGGM